MSPPKNIDTSIKPKIKTDINAHDLHIDANNDERQSKLSAPRSLNRGGSSRDYDSIDSDMPRLGCRICNC